MSRLSFSAGLFFLLLLPGCASTPSSVPPAETTSSAPIAGSPVTTTTTPAQVLGTVVFMGDSLTAGAQNDSYNGDFEPYSYPAQMAGQAGFALTQPLIAPPGIPAEEVLVRRAFPQQIALAPGASSGRVNTTVQVSNVAVPGQTLDNLLYLAPHTPTAGDQNYTDVVLGYPLGSTATQLQAAVALKPTTICLWIGTNDIAPALYNGNPAAATPLPQFTADFATLMTTLKAQTGAHLLVANLPDFSQFPFLTSAATLAGEVSGYIDIPVAQVLQTLGLTGDDYVNTNGSNAVLAALDAWQAGNAPPPLPDADVLTPAKLAQVETTLAAYNAVIAAQVAAAGGTLVDLHTYFKSLASGVTINGSAASLQAFGGLVSLDGVHLTNTGYALLANQFIAAANSALSVSITPVDVSAVAAKDPLFGANLPQAVEPRNLGVAGRKGLSVEKPGPASRQAAPLVAALRSRSTRAQG